jgi:hypothetical protein
MQSTQERKSRATVRHQAGVVVEERPLPALEAIQGGRQVSIGILTGEQAGYTRRSGVRIPSPTPRILGPRPRVFASWCLRTLPSARGVDLHPAPGG